MPDVLNPDLYNRLCQRFGEVRIHSPGEHMQGCFNSNFGKPQYHITQFGESYGVNCFYCPKCGNIDTRQRLAINHRWGLSPPDSSTNQALWHLAVCYNNGCQSVPGFHEQLRKIVYGTFTPQNTIIKPSTKPIVIENVDLPGLTVKLNQLQHDHVAVKYVQDRGFDVDLLSEKYGVSYCYNSDRWPVCTGRIIIPFYGENTDDLIGWQARLIGTTANKHNPKYFSMGGSWINGCLYNRNRGLDSKIAILVEGVTDVWRLDVDGAMALLGKNLKSGQKRLVEQFETVVVLLDSDAKKDSENLCNQLKNKYVINVQLPEGNDPGDMEREELLELIWVGLDIYGIELGN